MALTAKGRSTLAIQGARSLSPSDVIELIESSTDAVKGGGSSPLTSGLSNLGPKVHLENKGPGTLCLSINSGKRLLELCTFTAEATTAAGATRVRVGGLDRFSRQHLQTKPHEIRGRQRK